MTMGIIVSAILLILAGATIFYIASVAKNRNLPIDKKLIWMVLILFAPIIGGIIYTAKKGE